MLLVSHAVANESFFLQLTLTLCMLMRFPQLSKYCLRSLSWKTEQLQCSYILIKSRFHLCNWDQYLLNTCMLNVLTRYSNTRVRQRSVWMMSCSVTMLACFRFFSRDTGRTEGRTVELCCLVRLKCVSLVLPMYSGVLFCGSPVS